MRMLKFLAGLVAAAGVVAVALVFAPSVSGQRGAPPDQPRHETMLPWSGAEIGASVRDGDAGVVVDTVRPGSAAEKAGLRRGDVITEFDGERVRSARQFTRLVRETAPDRTVKAVVQRDGKRAELQIAPVARSADFYIDTDRLREDAERVREEARALAGRIPYALDYDFGGSHAHLGVTVEELSDQLATYFGAKGGVLVSSVAEGSAAAKAGLKAGDVITAINGAPVRAHGDLTRGLRNADGEVTLTVVRDRREMTVKAPVERRPRTTRR